MRKSPIGFYTLIKQYFVGIRLKDIQVFLMKQESYQRQKKQRIKNNISNNLITKPLQRLQMDLTSLKPWEAMNSQIKYILVIIDLYSRYVWTFALKNKKSVGM